MTDCSAAGWSIGAWGATPWAGGSADPGGAAPVYLPDYDLFCVGPCAPASYLPTYEEVVTTALSGQVYADGFDLVVLSGPIITSDLIDVLGVDTSASAALIYVGIEMPARWTLEFTVKFDSLPNDFGDLTGAHIYIGGVDNGGACAGLFFSKVGMAYTGSVYHGEVGLEANTVVFNLEDSASLLSEGEQYTGRLVVDHTLGVTYVYFTKTSELGGGHELRYVLSSIPSSDGLELVADGCYISVRGTNSVSSQLHISTFCAGSSLLMSARPPIADAGFEQEVQLCKFVQLDGGNSYDVHGGVLEYDWRCIDAPDTSSYVTVVHDGATGPLPTPTGLTNKIVSNELVAYHSAEPIAAGDVLLINGVPYTVDYISTGSVVAHLTTGDLPDNLQNAVIKLIRQGKVFDDPTLQKPNFFPDAAGFWKFDLGVAGSAATSVRSVTVVHTKESLTAAGVTPEVNFIWNYLSDFWRLLEDPGIIEAFWSALSQIVGANMMALWQVDYNKSLRDIQRTMQRRWLYYDLLVQEPFVALTTVAQMDNTGGFLVGSDGVRVQDRTYRITQDLSGEDVRPGDFLILNGLAYEIAKYVPAGGGITKNRLVTFVDIPSGINDYEIARACSSTQIDFYGGLVVAEDDVVFEVVEKESGTFSYYYSKVMGVCAEHPSKLLADTTPVSTYLDDDAYSVYLMAVFRRGYLPVNDRIVDIPRLQRIIKDPPSGEVLHRGVDFFLDTLRGVRCIRWANVWVHEDPEVESGYAEDPTPPARMWAEVTYIENLSTVEANFGKLASFTLDAHAELPNHIDYLSAVRGLWYVHFSGASLYHVRVGSQILLGLPFAEERGTIQEIRNDIVSPTNTIFILDDGEDGVVRSYNYPSGLELEENPTTGHPYAVGDHVEQFAPLVKGALVIDYKSDPAWFGKFVGQGIFSEAQKFHRFGLEIEQDAYTLAGATMARKLLLDIRPTYTRPTVIGKINAGLHDIDVQDTIAYCLRLSLWEGVCHNQAFGHASMWDEGDPSPMKMQYPPDGGAPMYDHERIPGVNSGWQSAYDEPVSRAWTESLAFQVAGPPNVTSTPMSTVTAWAHEYATATLTWLVLRIEAEGDHPDTYDTAPLYEVAIQKNGVDEFVYPINLLGQWTSTGGIFFVERGVAISPSVAIGPTDELDIVVRPQVGSTNAPDWTLVYTRPTIQFSYIGNIVWGYDRQEMCPETVLGVIIYCDWPGGTPQYDNPLFAFDTSIYTAAIVGGHVVLDTTPITWTYDHVLAAGLYGRRVTL